MITFSSISFIFYTIFVSVFSIIFFKILCHIIDDIRGNKKIPKKKKVKSSLKIGGIYGRPKSNDKNNPFSPIHEYDHFVAILDVKPSRDGDCYYCQYIFLNGNMSPYISYSDTMIYSDIAKSFDDWEYIKDIDLNTIKFS